MNFFANNLPPLLTMVITSRAAVPISHRAKKIAAGELVAIDTNELGFTKRESLEFLSRHSATDDEQAEHRGGERQEGESLRVEEELLLVRRRRSQGPVHATGPLMKVDLQPAEEDGGGTDGEHRRDAGPPQPSAIRAAA